MVQEIINLSELSSDELILIALDYCKKELAKIENVEEAKEEKK